MKTGILPRRSMTVCILTAPLLYFPTAQSSSFKLHEIVVESKAYRSYGNLASRWLVTMKTRLPRSQFQVRKGYQNVPSFIIDVEWPQSYELSSNRGYQRTCILTTYKNLMRY